MHRIVLLIFSYFVFVNLLGFSLMGFDKRQARKFYFRVPEATLFSVALIGGSIGSLAGMYVFRHKTRKWYFIFGMPAILFLQLSALVALLRMPFSFALL